MTVTQAHMPSGVCGYSVRCTHAQTHATHTLTITTVETQQCKAQTIARLLSSHLCGSSDQTLTAADAVHFIHRKCCGSRPDSSEFQSSRTKRRTVGWLRIVYCSAVPLPLLCAMRQMPYETSVELCMGTDMNANGKYTKSYSKPLEYVATVDFVLPLFCSSSTSTKGKLIVTFT